eukprot:4954447-Prorocentrum_lima.AAC.1
MLEDTSGFSKASLQGAPNIHIHARQALALCNEMCMAQAVKVCILSDASFDPVTSSGAWAFV